MIQKQILKKVLITFFIYIVFSILISYMHYEILNLEILDKGILLKTQKVIENDSSLFNTNIFSLYNICIIIVKELINILLITFVIQLGFLLLNKKEPFYLIIESVIKAKYVFLISIVFEIISLKLSKNSSELLDINYYSPLSLINFFDYKTLELWFVYPLQNINVFEIIFIFLIAYFIKLKSKMSFYEILKTVGITYFIMMILWFSIVMFIILNNS